MSKTNGKRITRTTELMMAAIMGLTGCASLLAWGSKGFTDWNVMGWFGYSPEQEPAPAPTPDADPQAVAADYNFVMPLASSRAVSSEATTELENYIKTHKNIVN